MFRKNLDSLTQGFPPTIQRFLLAVIQRAFPFALRKSHIDLKFRLCSNNSYSFTSKAQTELKNMVFKICKAIFQKIGKGTQSCPDSFAHTAATLKSAFSVLTIRAISATTHFKRIRKRFSLRFISDGSFEKNGKWKIFGVRCWIHFYPPIDFTENKKAGLISTSFVVIKSAFLTVCN